MARTERFFAVAALAGIFCTPACVSPSGPKEAPATSGAASAKPPAATVTAASPAPTSRPAGTSESLVVVPERDGIVTIEPVSEPRYAPPESLKQFRFPQKNQPGVVLAKPSPARPTAPRSGAAVTESGTRVEIGAPTIATVTAESEGPRYKAPDSLQQWGSGRKVPLYEDPTAAPWQATPTEPRLQNAAVSCNYKDEGGVRGKVMLLIDDFKVTRFNARIEMPNGGVCQFDSKKMEQRPFEQGIALQSTGDECVVRMWEQKHRITIAAYSCHKQCSKGSFSYLWPILMDTRIGTCY